MPADDPAEAERLRQVDERLRGRAAADGFLPFDEFQEIALYAPGIGYYDAPGRRLGPEGDFYTAAHVHALFGTTLAGRIVREFDRLGAPARFRVVELGPGDGTLARSIIAAAAPELEGRTRFEYVLVERSDPLRRRATEAAEHELGEHVLRTEVSLAAEGPIVGVVVGNEFLDAQPTRRFVRTETGWDEIGVRFDGGRWKESLRAPVGPLPRLPEEARPGTVIEVSPAAEGFVREIGDHLLRGSAILLDYGFDENDLVQGRPGGTLQATRGHRVLDDPLDAPGSADLSTFVNFSRMRSAATRSGLREVAYGSQAEALGRWGFEARFRTALAGLDAEAEVRLRLAAKNLLFGFDGFRVLELQAAEGKYPDPPPDGPASGSPLEST